MSADPVSIALALGVNLVGQQAQASAARAQARALERNAEIAREIAAEKAGESRRTTKRVLGRQRALFLKSGVRLEGTPLLVQQETAAEGELEALRIARSGDLESARLLNAARAARLQGRAALGDAIFSVGRTLLTSAFRPTGPSLPGPRPPFPGTSGFPRLTPAVYRGASPFPAAPTTLAV